MAGLLGKQQEGSGADVPAAAATSSAPTTSPEVAELAETGEVAPRVGASAPRTRRAMTVGLERVWVVVLGVLVMGVHEMPPVVGRGGPLTAGREEVDAIDDV